MIYKFRVVAEGTFPEDLEADIKMKFISVKNGMLKLGNNIRNHMADIIARSIRRKGSTGSLVNSIRVYTENNDTLVGIGLLSLMDIYAPHWYKFNYGGMVKARLVPGYFGNYNPPIGQYKGTWMGKEEFFYRPRGTSGPRYLMKVDFPMKPTHYIERTKAYILTIDKVHFYNWLRTVRTHDKKKQIV